MLNAAPESESGLPTTSTPAEAVDSVRTETMRPEGQDVVSYLRAMARAEPEPTPEPEPRSPLQALLDQAARAVRSASAIAGSAARAGFRSSAAKSQATEARNMQVAPEPVAQTSTPAGIEPFTDPPRARSATDTVTAPPPAVAMAAPAEPRLTVLRTHRMRWLRAAPGRLRSLFPEKRTPAAADARPSRLSHLIAWRGSLHRAADSAWSNMKTLPAAAGAGMSVLRSGWGRLRALTPVVPAKVRRLEQFSMRIARRWSVARAQASEPASRKPNVARPKATATAASVRAARQQPVSPDWPFRSAPARSPEPVPPLSPFRTVPPAAAVQPEAAFAGAPAAEAEGASVEPMTVAGVAAAAGSSSALRGEVLPPEPVNEQRVRADEPARVINMQPGARSAVPASGSVSRS